MKALLAWLDHRTGAAQLTREVLYENIPGGARWRYVWGSTLTFCLMVQMITGVFLWMGYSAGAQSAWESVYYIQHEMPGGWFLRGLHHYTAQAMNVLLVLHLLQVVIDGAYKAPREVNFWFGVGLLGLTMGLSLTGYLLPWDQKGYWATQVATNIAALTPVFGDSVQRLIIGGSQYGHHTLTRFFALHAGVLPALIVLLVVAHVMLFRRHGITAKKPLRRRDAPFWPDQVFRDAVACLAVLAAVIALTLWFRGAPLYAPADPSESFSAARPEWYFLFLFEMLKHFKGGQEVWGAIYLPSIILLIVLLMPFIGRWRIGRWGVGHALNVVILFSLLGGAVGLTVLAMRKDSSDPDFRRALAQAQADAERVVVLAQSPTGIPEAGAIQLLRNDSLTQGPRLFARHCASCHLFDGHNGLGLETPTHIASAGDTWGELSEKFKLEEDQLKQWNVIAATNAVPPEGITVWLGEPPSAPDLKNFGSREWLAGLLDPDRISEMEYYGGTKFRDGKMARYVKRPLARSLPDAAPNLAKVIAAVSAEAGLPYQSKADSEDESIIIEGRELFHDEFGCTDCHAFRKPDEDASAPDLTGWGSKDWIVGIINNPAHETYYGSRNDRMPAFKDAEILDDRSIEMLADWLRRDWYMPPSSPIVETDADSE